MENKESAKLISYKIEYEPLPMVIDSCGSDKYFNYQRQKATLHCRYEASGGRVELLFKGKAVDLENCIPQILPLGIRRQMGKAYVDSTDNSKDCQFRIRTINFNLPQKEILFAINDVSWCMISYKRFDSFKEILQYIPVSLTTEILKHLGEPMNKPTKEQIEKHQSKLWMITNLKKVSSMLKPFDSSISVYRIENTNDMEDLIKNEKFYLIQSQSKFIPINENGDKVDLETGKPIETNPWIKVEDRLPTKSDEYTVTIKRKVLSGQKLETTHAVYSTDFYKDKKWTTGGAFEYEIIAWKELDKPYQPFIRTIMPPTQWIPIEKWIGRIIYNDNTYIYCFNEKDGLVKRFDVNQFIDQMQNYETQMKNRFTHYSIVW